MALKAYYKMNTGWTDSSGNGYDGTPNGAIINNVDQKLGAGCGQFLTNDDIGFSSWFDPSGLAEFSIDGWIKSDAGAANKCIFAYWDGTNGIYLQSHNGTDGFLFGVGNANANGRAIVTTTTMTYFSAVYFGAGATLDDKLKIYYNTVSQVLNFGGLIPTVVPSIITAPKMGSFPLIGRFWDGLIDDLAIYDHALTQAEIDYRYNGGAGREISLGNNRRKKLLMGLYNA